MSCLPLPSQPLTPRPIPPFLRSLSPQWVGACKASLQRVGVEKLALVQLHWSTAKYAPLQERLMWDGLVAIYEEVRVCVCVCGA